MRPSIGSSLAKAVSRLSNVEKMKIADEQRKAASLKAILDQSIPEVFSPDQEAIADKFEGAKNYASSLYKERGGNVTMSDEVAIKKRFDEVNRLVMKSRADQEEMKFLARRMVSQPQKYAFEETKENLNKWMETPIEERGSLLDEVQLGPVLDGDDFKDVDPYYPFVKNYIEPKNFVTPMGDGSEKFDRGRAKQSISRYLANTAEGQYLLARSKDKDALVNNMLLIAEDMVKPKGPSKDDGDKDKPIWFVQEGVNTAKGVKRPGIVWEAPGTEERRTTVKVPVGEFKGREFTPFTSYISPDGDIMHYGQVEGKRKKARTVPIQLEYDEMYNEWEYEDASGRDFRLSESEDGSKLIALVGNTVYEIDKPDLSKWGKKDGPVIVGDSKLTMYEREEPKMVEFSDDEFGDRMRAQIGQTSDALFNQLKNTKPKISY